MVFRDGDLERGLGLFKPHSLWTSVMAAWLAKTVGHGRGYFTTISLNVPMGFNSTDNLEGL